MKKFTAAALVLCLLAGFPAVSGSAAASGARLLEIYGNHMLFARNKPIRLAGYAPADTEIKAALTLGDGVLRQGAATASADGTFELAMDGVEGGYTKHEIRLYAGGELFAELTDVVFGELWLASGQSNMEYSLALTYEGFELSKTGGADEYIRALAVPSYPEYNGSGDNLPYEAQNDIKGASWCAGTETAKILNISAVAYFFACELRRELDVPVGILNASLGGSSIYTWLSRGDIEGDAALKNYLVSAGRYISAQQWDSAEPNPYANMTANYNKKIHPLRRFAPAGLIWYQGESDISAPHGAYTDAMNLMQASYSKLFGHEENPMPFVFTQIASFNYGNSLESMNLVGDFNIQLAEIQAQAPASRAMTTMYDVPLDWDTKLIDKSLPDVGAIHPMIKKPVGEKMAFAALGLVYGRRASYSAPAMADFYTEGNSVFVRFDNTGDSLAVKPINGEGTPLYGFSVAGADGVYLEAEAEITAPDTVRIWNDSVKSPASAAYAYSQVNNYSNLFATENGAFTLGASAFITARLPGAKYTQDKYWTTCDFDSVWRETDKPDFFEAFRAGSLNTRVSVTNEEKAAGTGALKVDYTACANAGRFSFGPALRENLFKLENFPAVNTDYSLYGTMSFQIKNDSGRVVRLDETRFFTSPVSWYSPLVKGTESVAAEIPPDGQWHTVTLDLKKLCLYGDEARFMANGGALKEVTGIELMFTDPGSKPGDTGTVFVDDFRFTSDNGSGGDFAMRNITAALTLVMSILKAFWAI